MGKENQKHLDLDNIPTEELDEFMPEKTEIQKENKDGDKFKEEFENLGSEEIQAEPEQGNKNEVNLNEENEIDELITKNDEIQQTNGLTITKPIVYNGVEIPIFDEDEAISLIKKGLEYQTVKDTLNTYKPVIRLIDEHGLTVEEIKALADIKQGNKAAYKFLGSKYGLTKDDDDFDTEQPKQEYKPEIPQQDPVMEIFENLLQEDPDTASRISSLMQSLPDGFKRELWNPEMFNFLINEVRSGEFDRTYARALIIKQNNPASTYLAAYNLAKEQLKDLTVEKQQKEPPKSIQQTTSKTTEQVGSVGSNKPKSAEDIFEELASKDVPIEEIEKEFFKFSF